MFNAEDANKLVEAHFNIIYRDSDWYKDLFETIKKRANSGARYYEYKKYTVTSDFTTGDLILPNELQFIIKELENLGYTTDLRSINSYYCARNNEDVATVQLIIHW